MLMQQVVHILVQCSRDAGIYLQLSDDF